MPPLN
jgi:hypothetical protein